MHLILWFLEKDDMYKNEEFYQFCKNRNAIDQSVQCTGSYFSAFAPLALLAILWDITSLVLINAF